MDLAGPQGPLHELSVQVTEAAEALVTAWTKASRTASPRLSALQLEALMILRHKPGINLTRMAVEIGAAPPAVSRLCDRLEAAGLLRREPGRTSRREIGLVLTAAGDGLIDALLTRRYACFGEALSRMPAVRRTELLAGLLAFSNAVRLAESGQTEDY
ncbi:MarR family transcriptional regulator [Streptomyces sp. NPDC058664]|uniref:MarR family transcriptional regulator n=1 Tax=unclassified Streptomyces TaxID=2593676 RepID=UPI003652BCC4